MAGDHAYFSVAEHGLHVADISNRISPTIVGSVWAGRATSVTVVGSYAFVAETEYGHLRVIDVSDPTAPATAATHADSIHPTSTSTSRTAPTW